jgi:hypothetical protein
MDVQMSLTEDVGIAIIRAEIPCLPYDHSISSIPTDMNTPREVRAAWNLGVPNVSGCLAACIHYHLLFFFPRPQEMSGLENITAACRPALVSLAITVWPQSRECCTLRAATGLGSEGDARSESSQDRWHRSQSRLALPATL